MSDNLDKLGQPTNLEDFDDPSILYQDHSTTNSWWTSLYQKRSVTNRNADLPETMMMIDRLLKQFESYYRNHDYDNRLLHLPYLFQKPEEGDRIRNKTTGEIYSIQEALVDPITKRWEGLIKLSATDSPPLRTQAHKIQFLSKSAYVRFTAEDPELLGNENQDSNGLIVDKGPVIPTVVYALIRKTPGSITTRPFGVAKQYRPRYRETHTPSDSTNHQIEISGQWFDNLLQFDCWTTDNLSADNLADWFERFMCLYGGVLVKNGVQQVLFLERLRDKAVSKWRQDLKSRALQYFIRTEALEARAIREITDIDLTIKLSSQIVPVVGEYNIAGQAVTGQISAAEYKDLFHDSNGNYLFGTTVLDDQNLT